MNYIDTHCHLAWDLDDGIDTIENCHKLLAAAQKDHIDKIVATPHFVCGEHNDHDIQIFQHRITQLKELAKSYHIEIYPGSELRINDLLFQHIQNKQIIPIADTNYILCEFTLRKKYDEEYDLITETLYELVIAGYTPILAHVERYFHEKIDISAIQDIVDMGCLIQVNTSSILNPRNNTIKNNIYDLLNHNLVHVIATDSHSYQGKRSPNMTETFSFLSKFYDKPNLNLLFYDNPFAIISNNKTKTTHFKKKRASIWRIFK